MRFALALGLGTIACGRIEFDPAPICVPAITHDEDADGLTDDCDPCPHLANANADRDGDGVGDACDPNPDTTGDVIRIFEPFVSIDPAWNYEGQQGAMIDDAYAVDTTGTMSMTSKHAVDGASLNVKGLIEIGFDIRGSAPNRQHQVSVIAGEISDGRYTYCEIDSAAAQLPQLAP